MDTTQLQVANEERDLGIIVSNQWEKSALLQLNKRTR